MLHIQLSWKEIYKVVSDTMLDNLLDQHCELFEPEWKNFRAKIHVNPQANLFLQGLF